MLDCLHSYYFVQTTKMIAKYLFAGALSLMAGSALATVGYCTGTPATTDGIHTSDVAFGDANNAAAADDCYGVVGKVNGSGSPANVNGASDINALGLTWGAWTAAGYIEDDGVDSFTLDGIKYTLTQTGSGQTGTWTLHAVDLNGVGAAPDLPTYLDIVFALKASSSYALWFFDDQKVDDSGAGAWNIEWIGASHGGALAGFSHLAVAIRQGTAPNEECTGDCGPNSIPEPGSLSLLGLGIVGLAASRYRRR